MPLFTPGTTTIREAQRQEERLTPGGQLNSLTFLERSLGRPKYAEVEGAGPMGILLTGHQGSMFHPGTTKREVTRTQMSNKSGWEYPQDVAITGNSGNLELVYNPSLLLHRELVEAPIRSRWQVVGVAAPPLMNMVAGEFLHLSASENGMQRDQQLVQTVQMRDLYGARYVPGALFGLKAREVVGGTITYTVERVDGRNAPNPKFSDTHVPILTADKTLAVNTGTGAFGLSLGDQGSGTDFSGTASSYDIGILCHSPGIGYLMSENLNDQNFNVSTSIAVGIDMAFATALSESESAAMFIGVYATPAGGLMYRA